MWPQSLGFNYVHYASDHNPLIFSINSSISRSPVSFRFLNIWCNHVTFNDVIRQVWDFVPFHCNRLQTVMDKLKAVKRRLIEWNKQTFGDIHKEVELASADLKRVQNTISLYGASVQLLNDESIAYGKLSSALLQQERYWKQKSSQHWLEEGD